MFRQAISATLPLLLTAALVIQSVGLQACGKAGPTPTPTPSLVPTQAPNFNNLPAQVTAAGCAAQQDVDTDGDGICDKVDKQIGAGCENNPDCNNDGVDDGKDNDHWYKNAWTFLAASTVGAMAALTLRSGLDCGSVNPFKGCFWNGNETTPTDQSNLAVRIPPLAADGNPEIGFQTISDTERMMYIISAAKSADGTPIVMNGVSVGTRFAYCIRSKYVQNGALEGSGSTATQTLQMQGDFHKSLSEIPMEGISVSREAFDQLCRSSSNEGVYILYGDETGAARAFSTNQRSVGFKPTGTPVEVADTIVQLTDTPELTEIVLQSPDEVPPEAKVETIAHKADSTTKAKIQEKKTSGQATTTPQVLGFVLFPSAAVATDHTFVAPTPMMTP